MNLSTIVKQTSVKLLQQNALSCLYDAELIPDFTPKMFTKDYWQERDAVLGHATGRGITWFVKHDNANLVLRHYYRGGLVGRMLTDQYVYPGLEKTRAVQEFLLLAKLNALNLPAPKPVAVNIERSGLIYRSDILIELIPGAKDLVGLLQEGPIDETLWHKIGETIKAFHQHRIYHHDLNSHNIMLDDKQHVWLIDFDQGQQMAKGGDWQKQNMLRLLRSFRKEKNKLDTFHWEEKDWQALMTGYDVSACI